MRKGIQQLLAILAALAIVMLAYAVWRGTAAAWIGICAVAAALAGLVAVHLPGQEDGAD